MKQPTLASSPRYRRLRGYQIKGLGVLAVLGLSLTTLALAAVGTTVYSNGKRASSQVRLISGVLYVPLAVGGEYGSPNTALTDLSKQSFVNLVFLVPRETRPKDLGL